MDKKYEVCKGCLALGSRFFGEDGVCLHGLNPHLPETNSCPCINCLIKMVCRDECEEFRTYEATSFNIGKTVL